MALPGTAAIERAGLEAWPGIEVEWDGSWVRRAANGFSKRANSVQALDPDDDAGAEARIAAAQAWLRARGLDPVFRTTPLTGRRVLAALDALGWQTVDASHLFAMPLRDFEADPRGALYAPLDPRFLEAQESLQGYDAETRRKLAALLGALRVPARGIVLYESGDVPVASALMSIADGIVVTGNVVTDPARRRQGHASAMMRTGLAWARAEGARVAALNVAADNPAGQALYRSLGYARQYDYAYRIPGEA